jgi:hypothetical protein
MTDKTQYNQDSSTSTLTKEEKIKACRKRWYQRNKEKLKAYRHANKEKIKACRKRWYQRNKEKADTAHKLYCQSNKKKVREYKRQYENKRKSNDPCYRLQCNMRILGNRVVKQLALGKKPACTEKWQGCSADELKAHLESLFSEGMSWDNYGKNGWHVDHIRPVSSFLAEDAMLVNHYTNLQPLWATDNISKSNKY